MARQLVLVLFLPILLHAPSARATHGSPLPDSATTPNYDYEVFWEDDNPYDPDVDSNGSCDVFSPGDVPGGSDRDYFPAATAQQVLDSYDNNNTFSVGNPNGHHDGFLALGFTTDDWRSPTRIYDCNAHIDCDTGAANSSNVWLPAPNWICADDAALRLVIGHEHFHHVQYGAGLSSGRWTKALMEGTARMMQDQIYSDLDADGGGMICCSFRGEANQYLNNTNRNLFSDSMSYDAALWWKYASEQFGAYAPEPNLGTDFIVRMFANAADEPSSADLDDLVNSTIRQTHPDSSLDEAFHDFTIANVAKEFDASGLDDAIKYIYLDEQDGVSPQFGDVDRAWDGSISDSSPKLGASSLVSWGAEYFEADISACPGGIAGYQAEGDEAAHGLLVVLDDGTVSRLLKGVSDDFARAIIVSKEGRTNPIKRLVATAGALGDPADFDYTFACGQASLEILRPNSDFLAYVGTFDEPQRFTIRLKISGPPELGTPTVQGLSIDDFEVYVGAEDPANQATLISGSEVQGEYWIAAQAPEKLANADFDLLVKLRDLTLDSEIDAIRYEDNILDHMVVIDRSGSMLEPVSFPRIDAAKNAASVVVDAESSKSQIGVVSFGGDNNEPNNDATVNAQLKAVTDAYRSTAKGAISGISIPSSSVLTSIGDGLSEAINEFIVRGTVVGKDVITLLSDGMENEADFVSTVTPQLINRGIEVHTIALGPWADQPLLSELATDTGGTFSYVDVGTTAPRTPVNGTIPQSAASLPASLPMQLHLAEAYLGAYESASQLERLEETWGSLVVGSQSVDWVLDESQVTDGRVTLAWSNPAASVSIKVYVNGAQLQHNVGGVSIYQGTAHIEVQIPQLSKGDMKIEIDSDKAQDFYAALSGRPIYGANLTVAFDQVFGERDPRIFQYGKPVRILAMLSQAGQAIGHARVLASVIHPTGDVDVLPLFDDGAHDDGEAHDGVYANIYRRTTVAGQTAQQDPPSPGDPGSVASYGVTVTATGATVASKATAEEAFQRIKRSAFAVYSQEKPDSDGDGLPDTYENSLVCLDSLSADATDDPDLDELPTDEEWRRGTNPCAQDTDAGGITDRSDIDMGKNPFDPADDTLPRPRMADVIDRTSEHQPDDFQLTPGAISIRYPTNPAYLGIRIWRGNSANGPFSVLSEFAPDGSSIFLDKTAPLGVKQYYRVQALGASGAVSSMSRVIAGVAKTDPDPPIGGVRVVDSATGHTHITTSDSVTLKLYSHSSDVKDFRVRNLGGSFTSWIPMTADYPWRLTPDGSGEGMVLVQYRDAAGNESLEYDAKIRVVSPGSVGRITGEVVVTVNGETIDPTGAVRVSLVGENLPAAYTNAKGTYDFADLPEGIYKLVVQFGDEQIEQVDIRVSAGSTTRPSGVIFTILTRPPPPRLDTVEEEDEALVLKYTAMGQGGTPISSFKGTCIRIRNGAVFTATGNSSAVRIEVTGLTNDEEYSCSVTATNNQGESNPSNVISGTPMTLRGLPIWLIEAATK